MKNLTERFIPAYARWVIHWRWPVLVMCLLAAFLIGLGVTGSIRWH